MNILQNLLNLLFPKSCMACNTLLLQNEKLLCTICRFELPITNQHKIPDNQSMAKFYGRVKIEMASSYLFYKKGTTTQNILHNLKYNNHPEISYFLGNLYAEQLKETQILETVDEIIAVPLHKSKQRKRGYNQVDGFAKALSENFDIPINKKLLIKSKKSKSQAQKGLFDRLKTKAAEFILNDKADQHPRHFLLLDDILTTGSTLEKCAKELLKIPDSKVTILCLAMSTKSF